MRRTSATKEGEVLSLILMGDTYSNVSSQTGVPVSTIKKIKHRNDEKVARSYAKVAEDHANSARDLLQQANKQIGRILILNKLGAIDISVNDLCRISSAMHAQTMINSNPTRTLKALTNIAQKYQ